MIPVLTLVVAALTQLGEGRSAQLEKRLPEFVHALGVDIRPVTGTGEKAVSGIRTRLTSHEALEYAWRPRPGEGGWVADFKSVPCLRSFVLGTHGGPEDEPSWFEDLRPPAWNGEPPELVIATLDAGGTAVGTLRLPQPAGFAEGSNTRPTLLVEEASAGCFIQLESPLPRAFENGVAELRYRWDLHSQVRSERYWVSVKIADQWMPPIPVILDVAALLPYSCPRVLELSDGEIQEVIVSGKEGQSITLLGIQTPPCLELLEQRVEPGALHLLLQAHDLPWHRCGPCALEFGIGNDVTSYSWSMRAIHRESVENRNTALLLVGAPGERVELWEREGVVRPRFPERLPCVQEDGLSRLSSLVVPEEAPLTFHWMDHTAVVVPEPHVSELMGRWRTWCSPAGIVAR